MNGSCQMHKLNKKTQETGITLDGLATMIKQSFDEVDEKLEGLQSDMRFGQTETKRQLAETNVRLTALEDGQDQMKLRLDNVAYSV